MNENKQTETIAINPPAPKAVQFDSQFDKVRKHFTNTLGMDWRGMVPLAIRADDLSWIIHLIEEGIEARKQRFKKEGNWDACAVMSIASWQSSLEDLVKQIMEGKVIPLTKSKSKKK